MFKWKIAYRVLLYSTMIILLTFLTACAGGMDGLDCAGTYEQEQIDKYNLENYGEYLDRVMPKKVQEKEKKEGLVPPSKPAPPVSAVPNIIEENLPESTGTASYYEEIEEDEPESTETETNEVSINIAGNWSGIMTATQYLGPVGPGLEVELLSEPIKLIITGTGDNISVSIGSYICQTSFDSNSRKLKFIYKTELEGSPISRSFTGVVTPDGRTIEGTWLETWPEGDAVKGTWTVSK
jgi:hypothetical protein